MKELSIEEKAKTYDKVVSKLKGFMAQGVDPLITRADVQDFFPQLQESEDERIRKELISFFTERAKYTEDSTFNGLSSKEIIGWLAKQGESDETKAKTFLINKGYPIDTNGIFPTYEKLYNIIKEGLEKQGDKKSNELPNGEDYGIDGLYHAIEILENTLGKVDGYQTDDGILEHKCAINAVKELYKQKHAEWHREDEQNLNACFGYIPDEFLRRWLTDIIHIKYDKFADEVKPKFKKGDWITYHGTENIYQVVAVIDNQYQLKYGDNYTIQKCASVDRCARLWDITKDAKDGDVLVAHECLVLFREIDGLNIRCYCTYHFMNNPSFYVDTLQNKDAFHPATKEQRDTLMKAMADARYTFNFEKKELKKIEQIG